MSIRHLQGAASDRLSQRHRQTPGTSPGSQHTPQIICLWIYRDPRRPGELIPQQGIGMITESGMIHTMKSAPPGSSRTPPQIIRLGIRRDPRRPRELIPQQGIGTITENGLTQRLTQAVSSLTHGYSYMPCATPADSTGAVRHHTRRRYGRRSQQARRHTLVSAAVGRPPNTTRRQAPP